MKSFIQFNETFDNPYPVTLKMSHSSYYQYMAKGDDIEIEIGKGEDDIWEVVFYRNGRVGITGEGDAMRVFATVISAIKDFIKKQDPYGIAFSAAKKSSQDSSSRSKLYARMAKKFASSVGYKYSEQVMKSEVHYTLKKV